jgi:hypothetical protein
VFLKTNPRNEFAKLIIFVMVIHHPSIQTYVKSPPVAFLFLLKNPQLTDDQPEKATEMF